MSRSTSRYATNLPNLMKLGIFIFPSLALLACVAHGQTYVWKNTAGGSWDVAGNWDTNPSVPVFGPGVVVDFSTLNITGSTKLLNLGSTGKVVAGSIDEVFRKVEAGSAGYGVVPVENSTEGAVGRTLDLLLANLLAGSIASGSYSVAKTVPNFVQSIISVLVAVFVPQLTIYFAQKKQKEMIHNISFSVKFIGALSAIPVGFLLAAGQDFFQLWVPTQDANLLHGLSALTLIPLAITSCTSIINNVFTVTNKLRIPSLVLLLFGVVNTIAVIVLMKCTTLGIWAIPIVALVTGLGRSFFFIPMYAAHCLGLEKTTFYPSVVRGALCTFVMAAVTFAYRAILPTNSWLTLTLCGIVCTIIACLANFTVVFDSSERTHIFSIFNEQFHKYLHK